MESRAAAAVVAAPPAPPTTGHTKQYVFVDEYNRHKRLKVMRACDGCRKRKIRCDGALQNGPWPCGACVRLKLKCVPPTLDHDDDDDSDHNNTTTTTTTTPNNVLPAAAPGAKTSGPGRFAFAAAAVVKPDPPPLPQRRSHKPSSADWSTIAGLPPPPTSVPASVPLRPDLDTSGVYAAPFFGDHAGPRLDSGYADGEYFASPGDGLAQFPSSHQMPPSPLHSQPEACSSASTDPEEVEATVKELTGQMGDLSIDITSIAPYIANEKKNLAETPAVEEPDVVLPPSVGADATVKIPPEMMPSEERAMDYFGYFFNYIHPYVPVLNRTQFYEQWRSARHSLSPLLLEAIFACVTPYLDEPLEARQWLALATRHEESFKDVPRLSTIQAMVLLSKAQEFVPKRGYYYRSWMAVRYMTNMALDLSLDEHYESHRGANKCKLSRADCLVRSRVWQTLSHVEILVGAPQGRTDFAVDWDTIDTATPTALRGDDALELATSRRFAYMAQAFRHTKHTNNLWVSLRRYEKDWPLDPAFVRHNKDLAIWLDSLPADIQLQFPDDGRPPWLGGDHFVAYIHVYHHLAVILHHRPQLQALLEKRDPSFKSPLNVCFESAIYMCRVQEAIVRDFGLHGLRFMLRGMGFTIYCVLTCVMLHLVAITSPDLGLNAQGRLYLTRHMRILEKCVPLATPEVRAHINALREAFSNDTSKPFELKPTLGLRSPALENRTTSSDFRQAPLGASVRGTSAWHSVQDAASSRPMSPASEYAPSFDPVAASGVSSQPAIGYSTRGFQTPPQSNFDHRALTQVSSTSPSGYALEQVISNEAPTTPVWDPSGIFHQWNSAFGPTSQPAQAPTSVPTMAQQPSPTKPPAMFCPQPIPSNATAMVTNSPTAMPAVTPVMWQDAFTSAYVSGHGHKRYRQEDLDRTAYGQYSKRRG